jgi:Ni/Co efflux regulator RcnB
MSFKRVLFAATATAACLAFPLAALAADPPNSNKTQHPAKPNPGPKVTPTAHPGGHGPVGSPTGGGGHGNIPGGHPGGHPGGGGNPSGHGPGEGGHGPSGGVHGSGPGSPTAPGVHGPSVGPAGGGHGPARSADHTQQRTQWRGSHPQANAHTVWRSNHNWWRGNARFNGYNGARDGFFFAPGFGYYAVPREYWGHSWGVGELLPLFFLSYAVADYDSYGLPPPPEGAEWVWVGNNVLLVDEDDGYVIDEIQDVY